MARSRSAADERNLNVEITEKGMLLRDEAVRIPEKMSACVDLTAEEAGFLYRILYQILGTTEDGAM